MSRHTPGSDGVAVVSDDQMREYLDGPSCDSKSCVTHADARRQQRTRFLMHWVSLCIGIVATMSLLGLYGIAVPDVRVVAWVLVGVSLGLLTWRVFLGSGSKRKAHFVLAIVFAAVASMAVVYQLSGL